MYPIAHILQRARALFPDRIAVIDGQRRVTYGELADRSMRLGAALRRLGLNKGDRVALLEWNSLRYMETYFACAHAGLALMPLNSRLAARELHYILQDSDARAVIFSPPFLPLYEDVAPQARSLEFAIGIDLPALPKGAVDYETLLAGAAPMPVPESTGLDEIVLIYYTSGTTGEPKGVCLTNRNLFAGTLDSLVSLSVGRDDIWLHAGPLFHIATAWAVWGMPMVGGAQVIDQFEPKRTLDVMSREKVTMTVLPGAILGMFARQPEIKTRDLSALRTMMYGGSPTPFGVLRDAAAALPPVLTHCYGITETAAAITYLYPHEHVFDGADEQRIRRTTSAGQPLPLIDVRVVDDDGRDVPTGAIGEIICGGPKIMAGYWRKPDMTAAAIRDGWYHTGDMGYLDDRRYLYVVDRKKDMIISGGENVYSVEVESALSTHPGVLEVAVIGVPDDKWIEAVKAIVVPRPGVTLTAEELIAFCRGKIAGYKIPRSVEFRADPMPKTGPGKIAKRLLRDPYWQGTGRRI